MRAELVSCFCDFEGRPTVSVLPIPRGERIWLLVDALPPWPPGSIVGVDLIGPDRAAIRLADLPRSGVASRRHRRNWSGRPGSQGRMGPPARLGLTEIPHQRGFFRLQSGDFSTTHDEDA